MLDVYAAREQPIAGISGATVAERSTVPVSYCRTSPRWPRTVAEVARPGDVIVTMGAGDVTMLGPEILTELQVQAGRNTRVDPERARERARRTGPSA